MERIGVRRALISVTDKRDVVTFARELHRLGAEIVSTGGTARALRDADVPVVEVSTLTGFPEILDGRVKTLHPAVHAGILHRRDDPQDLRTMSELGLGPIDLVAVNLYRFEEAVADGDVAIADALEEIDIGGPTLLRAAAKNWPHVVVAPDPSAYETIVDELRSGGVSAATRQRLAATVFQRTATYDAAIGAFLDRASTTSPAPAGAGEPPPRWPAERHVRLALARELRYGENPHQPGAFYLPGAAGGALAGLTVVQGKELSYNNLLDLDAGWRLAQALGPASAVVIKHRNPCGAAVSDSLAASFRDAWAGDSLSAFGGVIVLRGVVDGELAAALAANFVEVVAAEDLAGDAREILARKKRLTVVTGPGLGRAGEALPVDLEEIRSVAGGWLVQGADIPESGELDLETVTRRGPDRDETRALAFAWHVVRYVQSNAIVFARGRKLIGVGGGQTSRIDAVKLAIMKAGRERHDLTGSVMASDAFFPFEDSVQAAAAAGCTAVIQPGGSRRDDESIAAADAAGMAMVFTRRRAFRH